MDLSTKNQKHHTMKDNKNIIKILAVAIIAPYLTGCLIPGAPHHFGYRSTLNPSDSVDLVSMPHHIEYRLLPKGTDADSVFVLSPIDNTFKKMQVDKYFGNFYYESRQKVGDIKRIEKTDTVVLRVFKKNEPQDRVYQAVPKIKKGHR